MIFICLDHVWQSYFFRQSYDVDIFGEVGSARAYNSLDLKNPLFRYNGSAVVVPAGCTNESPSDALLQHPGKLFLRFSFINKMNSDRRSVSLR